MKTLMEEIEDAKNDIYNIGNSMVRVESALLDVIKGNVVTGVDKFNLISNENITLESAGNSIIDRIINFFKKLFELLNKAFKYLVSKLSQLFDFTKKKIHTQEVKLSSAINNYKKNAEAKVSMSTELKDFYTGTLKIPVVVKKEILDKPYMGFFLQGFLDKNIKDFYKNVNYMTPNINRYVDVMYGMLNEFNKLSDGGGIISKEDIMSIIKSTNNRYVNTFSIKNDFVSYLQQAYPMKSKIVSLMPYGLKILGWDNNKFNLSLDEIKVNFPTEEFDANVSAPLLIKLMRVIEDTNLNALNDSTKKSLELLEKSTKKFYDIIGKDNKRFNEETTNTLHNNMVAANINIITKMLTDNAKDTAIMTATIIESFDILIDKYYI